MEFEFDLSECKNVLEFWGGVVFYIFCFLGWCVWWLIVLIILGEIVNYLIIELIYIEKKGWFKSVNCLRSVFE